ncbi:peptide/nickel transport system permease protein [Azospirillum baldaniorum]|uniref:ABC transporter permease n=1 Tax=Azospirillum baldaniorum TaxID=1064539 RepID=UPI0011A6C621|nr:ABC transporter permease [Azospirillum baldaniorum]TWA57779.1 peptide/nickel transport system permease protein [Azospirillum baldaniorum]
MTARRLGRYGLPWRLAWRMARRLPGLLLLAGAAVLASFLASHALPGDPVLLMVDGRTADPEMIRRLREDAGLDQPIAVQFLSYTLALLRGDLGQSLRYGGVPVTALLGEALPVTLGLMAGAAALALPLGLLLGLAAADVRRAWPGTALTIGSVLALSVPPLALATWLMLAGSGTAPWAVAALALPAVAMIARLTRTQVMEVLGRDFIRTAQAKGLGRSAVLLRHALPNALVPLAAAAGSVAGTILTTTAAVETVFALPGVGRLTVQAVLARDHTVAGAAVLVFVLMQVAISLTAELLIGLADPRLRNNGLRNNGLRDDGMPS